jgi:hypothetical protein
VEVDLLELEQVQTVVLGAHTVQEVAGQMVAVVLAQQV